MDVTSTRPLTRAEALDATAAGFDPPELPENRVQALRRAAAAIHRAEHGGGQAALDAADRWLTLAHRWADQF